LVRLEGAGIQPGQTFKIQGTRNGDQIEICFMSGSDVEHNDIPLIIAVIKSQSLFEITDRKNGQVGKKVSKSDPFKSDDKIDLRLRLQEDRLQVFANLKNFMEFEYRQPLTSITHVNITGAIVLSNVSWGGKHYPVPYQTGIEGNFGYGRKLYVTGIPNNKAGTFSINLLNAKGDTLFHLSARMHDKNIVLNSNLEGHWGNEEKVKEFPFHLDTVFDIMIINEEYSFQVFLDGQHYCAFAHRAPSPTIDHLVIGNDVELFGVHVK